MMSAVSSRNIHSFNEKVSAAIAKGKPLGRRVQTGFDPETGEQIWVDTSSVRVRDSFNRAASDARRDRDKMFRRMRIDPIYVQSGSNYVEPLVEYFRRRAKRAH